MLSVFRTTDEAESAVWRLGMTHVEVSRGPILARADIAAGTLRSIAAPLDAVPAEPPMRHVHVIGWPLEKDERKLLALELAEHAVLILAPASSA